MYNKIQKQLEVLNTKIRFFGRTKAEDHLEALDQVGELGTPYDVQYIIHHVFSDNELISQKTATVIRKLLTKREVKTAWLNLYRSFSYYYGYDSLNKKRLKKFEHFAPEEAAHLYGIASLNHSGYVREEALGCFQNLSTSEVLPYVLLRLNDWVPQVQAKAREVLAEILPSISVTDLIKHHRLIEWLEKTERVKLKDVQDKIFTQIHDPRNREDLWGEMEKALFRERLFCWKALTEEIENDDSLIDKAIADPAPEIRQWAARHLPESGHLRDRLSILLADSAVRVRHAALKAIPHDDFAKYRQLFDAAIFDDSKPIREYARFMLRSHGCENHADRYRQRLSELKDSANPGLVAGLAENGAKGDIPLIKEFIDHKKPKIRASALAGLNRLEAEDVDNLYFLGLQDDNAKVRNTCISILQAGYSHLRPELEDLLENGNVKSQKAALKVLMHYGVLDSLQDILFALTEPHEELQEMAWQYLASWHHQHAVKLWFNYSDDTYEQTMKLLDKLRKTKIEPPYHARNAWNDLPNIMKTIKKEK